MAKSKSLTIVAVDDNPADFGVLRRRLQNVSGLDCQLIHCDNAAAVQDVLDNRDVDCLFLDYQLGACTGLDVLTNIRASGNDVPVITLTGQGNEAIAVEAMKRGAQDYLVKADLTPETLRLAIDNALEKVALTRKVAETQEEMRQFASTAAHDLKAPLRRVVQFCQQLQKQCDVKLASDEHNLMNYIVQNAIQMQRLIEDLLAYARVGRSEVSLRPVALDTVFATVIDHLSTVIEESEARIDVSPMPEVLGDYTALVQLFQNLIGNALKFRHQAPPIVRVHAQSEDRFWHVTVADNGIGIAPEHHQSVFAPFRRLHAPHEYEGSGIGLATCSKIVAQHHGQIWVESQLGQGTAFHLRLQAISDSR
jgi:light-regulated signal transduction histidine kinase (bacteriophytochrome)